MPLDDNDWQAIYNVLRTLGPPTEIIFGKVIKRDLKHKLVWINELGDTPINLVGFGANVTMWDIVPDENVLDVDMDVQTNVEQKVFQIDPIVPDIGEVVCVIRQFGNNRSPHCIGAIMSVTNYDPDNV